jgi:hypothetical protein
MRSVRFDAGGSRWRPRKKAYQKITDSLTVAVRETQSAEGWCRTATVRESVILSASYKGADAPANALLASFRRQ